MAQLDESVMVKLIGQYAQWRQYQSRTNWCWDATAVSIANFYASNLRFSQCQLATLVLNQIYAAWLAQNPNQPKFDCCAQVSQPNTST